MIRKMEKSDIDTIADIWLDTNIKAHSFIPARYWKEQFEAVKEMLPQAELYVCEQELNVEAKRSQNRVCGFIGMNGEYIEGIFVREGYQSKGAGKALMDFVKSVKDHLVLRVYRKNDRAVQFYLRQGFRIQTEGVDTETGEKELMMMWRRPDV